MKKLTTILLMLGMWFTSFSQTADYPWAVGGGAHWASFSDVSMPLKDQFKDMQFQGGIELSVGRYLNRFFNIQLSSGIMNLKKGTFHDYTISDPKFWHADLDGQIKFLGSVIKEDAILTPYFYFGFGGQYLNHTAWRSSASRLPGPAKLTSAGSAPASSATFSSPADATSIPSTSPAIRPTTAGSGLAFIA